MTSPTERLRGLGAVTVRHARSWLTRTRQLAARLTGTRRRA